jgi:hypothetical protein
MKNGDIVSYNFAGSCSKHLYHHSCIKEWLLRHLSCPACRQTYLPIDEADPAGRMKTAVHQGSMTISRHLTLSRARTQWINRTYVCERIGLVVMDLPQTDQSTVSVSASSALPQTTAALDWIRKSCPAVKRHELVELRGNKADEGRTFSTDADNEADNQEVAAVDVPMGITSTSGIWSRR